VRRRRPLRAEGLQPLARVVPSSQRHQCFDGDDFTLLRQRALRKLRDKRVGSREGRTEREVVLPVLLALLLSEDRARHLAGQLASVRVRAHRLGRVDFGADAEALLKRCRIVHVRSILRDLWRQAPSWEHD